MIDKPLTNVALLVFVFRTGAAGCGASIENHRGSSMLVHAGERVLKPGPIPRARGDTTRRAKAIEWIISENIGVERLVPHRIGNDDVVRPHLAIGCPEFWVDHRVAARNLDVHVVNYAVHLRDGIVLGLKLLSR